MDAVELRVERPERLAERRVEGVDRAVAVGGGVEDLAVDLDLDGRLGEELAALALLDEAGVVDDPERRRVVRLVAADQQLEARLGALEREALALELLDELAEDLGVDDAVELVAELLGADPGVRLAAQLADDEPALVADGGRVDVLVAPLDLRDRGAVDAALVGERGPADIRLLVVRVDVGDLRDGPAELGQARSRSPPPGRHQLVGGLQGEVGEDRDHVRVAGPLAVAVDRRLDVADARRRPRPASSRRPSPRRCGCGCPTSTGAPAASGSASSDAADVVDDRDELVRSGSRRSCRTGRASGRPPRGPRGASRGRSRGRP